MLKGYAHSEILRYVKVKLSLKVLVVLNKLYSSHSPIIVIFVKSSCVKQRSESPIIIVVYDGDPYGWVLLNW